MSGSKALVVLCFLLGVPAFAQFEISPDHFDGDAQKPPAQHSRLHVKVNPATRRAASRANARKTVQPPPARAGKVASTESSRKSLQKTRTVSALQSGRVTPQ
jgi:hypothetical protein